MCVHAMQTHIPDSIRCCIFCPRGLNVYHTMIWYDMIYLILILTLVSSLLLFVEEKIFEIRSDKHYHCWCNTVKKWTNTLWIRYSKDGTFGCCYCSQLWRLGMKSKVGHRKQYKKNKKSLISLLDNRNFEQSGMERNVSSFRCRQNFLNL